MFEATRPQARWVASGIGAGFVWTAAKVTVPLLAAAAINLGMEKGRSDVTLRFVGLMLAVGVVQAVCTGWRRYSAFRIALRVETDLRQRLFAHLQRLHFAFHDEAQTGQLMARANTDIQQIHMVVILLPLTVAATLTMATVIGILLYYSVGLALIVLGLMPLLLVAASRFSRKIQPINLALQEELGDLSGVVEESVSGVRVIKGFGSEKTQVKALEHEADAVLDNALAASRLRALFLPLVDFIPTLALVAILWYGGHQVLNGQLQIGDLVAFNAFVLMLIWPLRMLGMLLASASRASSAGGRIQEILSTDPAIADRPGARDLVRGVGAIRFDNVSFGYADGSTVLDGFDLEIAAGESVALVGSTGCGKTTVARLLPRFYDVREGRILIDGVDVRDATVASLRRNVGIVFDDTFLFSDSIRENIAFAEPDASIEAVRRAATLAGADEFIDELADGYDTVIGEHGYSLSGGQRQRIAIARAILADPQILILDDATSAVDPAKEHEIRAALEEVMISRTTLIIAHRPATIALADRVVLIDGGRVVAEGSHEFLLESSAHYRQVLAHAQETEAADSGTAEVPA